MTLRLVTTALGSIAEFPSVRDGAFDSALAEAFVASPARDSALARLREPGAVVVTTGQQPGLFTGPLYTIYKALSTAALARIMERQWQRPVVPVFWVAGDDHDFAEASHTSWITSDGEVRNISLPPRPPDAPLTPLYRERPGDKIEELLDTFAADLPASEFRTWTIEWLRRYYRPEVSLAAGFAGALAEVLAPSGIICLQSTHPAVKRAAARHLIRALGLTRELNADLEHRSHELLTLGMDAGVAVGEGATLVMLEGPMGRDRLLLEDGDYVTRRGRQRYDLEALQRIAAAEPERLSPNVLLRPVIESALLPTVAYVGGPGELKYLALTPPIYERMRVPRQPVLPRWSGVIVEPKVDRILEKFDIDLLDLLEPPGALEARLVRSRLPDSVSRTLQSLREELISGYDRLARGAAEIDPTLTKSVQGTKNQALAALRDVEKKLVQHLKRRQEVELGQLARARTLVLPEGQPQERLLTVASFLARYGPTLLQELSESIEGWYAAALEGALHPS